MTESDIHAIVTASVDDDGERLEDLANQFRRGRDASDLLALLDASETAAISVAAWILGELDFSRYDSEGFVSRLRRLLDHPDAEVRFHALGALFPALDPHEPATRALLQKMRSDPANGVRARAEAAAARLSLK
jgi:HEAT repeat protein